jgi:hypothetical protein
MAPSLASAVANTALFAGTAMAYSLSETWSGESFLNKFTFSTVRHH